MAEKEKIGKCPYCGSTKLEKIDWGFANWECQTCRNNFKTPYYETEEAPRQHNSSHDKFGFSDLMSGFIKYFLIILFSLSIIIIAIFFIVRIYQISLPFL
ncbi:hypothetical protein [uncultured Methanobrevibacter sp.]|uniref:hypothetical protein n=1 Tax=uncultured Methanobrevibacter sp. TaxID=253161 RepID=UPI0025D64FCD|nr:hypothetical protein [uncultured Methanobrevibacter sp.]